MISLNKIFIITIMSFSFLLSDDLYVKVNYGDTSDVQHNTTLNYYNANLSQWDFANDSPQNNKDKKRLTQQQSQSQDPKCFQSYCDVNSQEYTEFTNNFSQTIWNNNCSGCQLDNSLLKNGTCSGIALIDSNINIEQLVLDKINSTSNKFVPFIPKIVIKRGSFSVKKGNINGDIINNYTDINILSRMLIRIKDDNSSNYKEPVLDYLKNNLNIKNWKYTHFKNGFNESSTHYNYYLTQTKSMIDTLYADTTVEEADKSYLEYLREILNLGLSLENSYLSNANQLNNSSDACILNTEWKNKLNLINDSISNVTSDNKLISFMKKFALDKSLIQFTKVAYKYNKNNDTQQVCNGNSCDNSSCAADESCYCNCNSIDVISTSDPVLNKIYGYKTLTQEGKSMGTYARTILFEDFTTPFTPFEISINGGSTGEEFSSNFGTVLDTINTYDTSANSTGSSSSSVNDLKNKVNSTKSINKIEEDCKNDIDTKFAGNLVFIDHSSLLVGNNELIVKSDFNAPNPIKLNSIIMNPVFKSLNDVIKKEHLILNLNETLFTGQKLIGVDSDYNIIYNNNGTVANVLSFPDLSKDMRDLSYYYLWTNSPSSNCTSALSNNNITTPFLLMSNSSSDLDGYKGDLTNIPNEEGGVKYKQYATSTGISVLNTNEDGFDRGSDGEIDAEIEKRLDINDRKGSFKFGTSTADPDLKDKPLFPNNMFAYSYTVGYKPADDFMFDTYGPVGPFWNKTEKTITLSYKGCDEEVKTGTIKFIPSKTQCTNTKCNAASCSWVDTATGTIKNSSNISDCVTHNVPYICNDTTDYKDGFFSIYNEGNNTCTCSSGGSAVLSGVTTSSYPQISNSTAANYEKYNKFCYLSLEPMKAKVKKIKWYFEPQKVNMEDLNINGFSLRETTDIDTNSTEMINTQWGGWTQTFWETYDEVLLEDYVSDNIGTVLEWEKGAPEPDCNWSGNFEVNNRIYNYATNVKEMTTAKLNELSAFTEGIKFSKEQIYTLNNEKKVAECLRDKDTSDENSIPLCVQKVYAEVSGNSSVASMSVDSFSTHFNNKVIKYYEKANEIGFGKYFVVKSTTPIKKNKIVSFPSISSILNSNAESLKSSVFKDKTIDKNNLQNLDIFWSKENNN